MYPFIVTSDLSVVVIVSHLEKHNSNLEMTNIDRPHKRTFEKQSDYFYPHA